MDEGGFAELYRIYAPLVHARARRLVGDDADEVVQELFIRLWRAPPLAEAQSSWIYVTSTHLCLDRLRHQARRNGSWEADLRASVLARREQTVELLLAEKEICRRLLARADERTQQVVMLIYFDEMTQEEAAATLGLSRKTVAQRLARFLEQAHKMVSRWR